MKCMANCQLQKDTTSGICPEAACAAIASFTWYAGELDYAITG